ncbi:hypothetical protein DYB32_001250 [Aphanomyces invadans]|uniref:Uncharacterized protein n=1 Tax=Aphanomyces invadans TaxID=157072 RepID=A0A418B728_9STRA|nr:hypothetical protein DYB32_001250 [Aphanomyces invadans]
MWSALFGSDESTTPQQDGDEGHQDKVYGAGEEPDAMSMLLGRLTHLLERLGEAEYSKKKWEEQARKFEAANVQLKYELEYSSDAQLRERIDDLTAMNEALKDVKMALEKDIEAKDAVLRTHEEDIARLNDALQAGSLVKEELDNQLEQLKVSSAQDLERLSGSMERQTQHVARLESQYDQLAQEREQQVQSFHATEQDLRGTIDALQLDLARRDEEGIVTLKRFHQSEERFSAELADQKRIEESLRASVALLESQVAAEKSNVIAAEHSAQKIRAELVTKSALESQSQWKEDSLRALTVQVKTVQRELSDALELNLRLSDRNEALEREKHEAVSSSERNQAASATLSHQLHVVQSEYQSHMNAADAALAQERAVVDAKTREIEVLQYSIQDYERSIAEATANVDCLREEIETLHGRTAQLTSEVQAVEHAWTAKYDELLQDWTDTKQLAAERKQQVVDAEDAKDALLEQVHALNQALNDAQRNAATQDEIAQLQAELFHEREQYQANAAVARAEVEHLQQSVAKLQESVAAWEQQANESSAQVELLQQDNRQLNELLAGTEQVKAQLQSTQDALEASEAKAQSYASQLDTLEQRVVNVTAEKNELEALQGQLEQQVATTEAKLAHVEQSIEALRTQHEADMVALTHRLESENKTTVENLMRQVQNSQEFATECEATSLEWEEKCDLLMADLTAVQERLEQAEQAITTAEKAKTSSDEVLASQEASKREVEAELENARIRVSTLESSLTEHKEHVDTLTQQLDHANSSLGELTSALQQVKDELAAATHHAHEKQAGLEKAWKDSQDMLDIVQSQRIELESSLASAHARIEHLETSVHQDSSTVSHLAAENSALQAAVAAEKNALAQLKAAHDSMLQQVQTTATQIEARDAQVAALTAQLEAQAAEFERAKDELRQELAQTKTMLGNVHASAEMASQNLEDHIRELQEQMHSHNNKFEGETEELLEEISSLNGQISELQVQNNVLSARAHRLARDLSQYVKLPADDMALVLNPNTPNLWELLANGMEQLKSDLEIASTYAANLDQMDSFGDGHQDNFNFGGTSQEIVFIDHPTTSPSGLAASQHADGVAAWIQ